MSLQTRRISVHFQSYLRFKPRPRLDNQTDRYHHHHQPTQAFLQKQRHKKSKKNTKRDKIKDGEKTNQENKPKFRAECKKYESDKTKVRFGNGAERIVKMAEQKTHFVYDLHPHIHGFKENCRFLCV